MGSTCSNITSTVNQARVKPAVSRLRIVENFIIIWLDTNISESNKHTQNSIHQLQRIANAIKTFTEIETCLNYLNQIKTEKIFMIVSGSIGQHILPMINDMTQLDSVYIFCNNPSKHTTWIKEYKKIQGIFNEIEPICKKLQKDIRRRDEDLTAV
ncbi:hypothetical protein I4U23_008184, partial [Adineta vaga]